MSTEQDPHMERTEPEVGPIFEASLRRAMQRVEVRAQLTQKLLALADGPQLVQPAPRGKVLAFRRAPLWLGSAIAAMLVLGVFAGERIHQHREEQRAEQQFEAADRITNQALERVRQQVERAGITLDAQ